MSGPPIFQPPTGNGLHGLLVDPSRAMLRHFTACIAAYLDHMQQHWPEVYAAVGMGPRYRLFLSSMLDKPGPLDAPFHLLAILLFLLAMERWYPPLQRAEDHDFLHNRLNWSLGQWLLGNDRWGRPFSNAADKQQQQRPAYCNLDRVLDVDTTKFVCCMMQLYREHIPPPSPPRSQRLPQQNPTPSPHPMGQSQ
jgi:hypothetical protein